MRRQLARYREADAGGCKRVLCGVLFLLMQPYHVRIASILLICSAATPVAGGPRGGAHFGGGGHFGPGGGFAAPHITAPRAPLTSPVAPQLSARPPLQRVTPGS